MSKRTPRMPGQTKRSHAVLRPTPPPRRSGRPSLARMLAGKEDPWIVLRAVLEHAAHDAGRTVDVDMAIRCFKGAVTGYGERKAGPQPLAARAYWCRMRRLATSLSRLERALDEIGSAERRGRVRAEESVLGLLKRSWTQITGVRVPVPDHDHIVTEEPREAFTIRDWRGTLMRARTCLEFELPNVKLSPKKAGARGDRALMRFLLEVGGVLGLVGLLPRDGGYPFTACAEIVAWMAKARLPRGKSLQKKLKPLIVRLERMGLSGEENWSSLRPIPAPASP